MLLLDIHTGLFLLYMHNFLLIIMSVKLESTRTTGFCLQSAPQPARIGKQGGDGVRTRRGVHGILQPAMGWLWLWAQQRQLCDQ